MKIATLTVHAAVLGAVLIAQAAAAPTHASPKHNVPFQADWYLHPQRLVDVGGRRLNMLCTGSGSPTVILEAGLMADMSAWRLVQPAISRRTRVCSYDRAGLGFSDPSGPPRDAAAIVRDLRTLLDRAHIAPPYVLVGWSSGGPYTRLFQYRYPHDVVGLVEVDPDSEFEVDDARIVSTIMKKPPQWYNQQGKLFSKQFHDCAVTAARGTCALHPGGLAAFRKRQRAEGCPTRAPAECAIAEVRANELTRGSLWEDEALELDATDKNSAEIRAARRPYGNLPLIVLTDAQEADIDYSGHPISVPAQRAMWASKNDAQQHLAELSNVGAHFVVANAPHAIPLFAPAVVVSAIDEVLDQVRYNASYQPNSI